MTRIQLLLPLTVLATGVAMTAGATAPGHPGRDLARVAVVAAPDASNREVARAEAVVARRAAVDHVTVRRTGGAEEARAQIAALAASDYAVVAGAGPVARAAIAEARESGPATQYVAVR